MLCTPPSSDAFPNFKKIGGIRAAAALKYQGALMLEPNLTREFSYSRWSGHDCKEIDHKIRRLLLRAGGLQNFYDLMNTWQDRYHKASERQEEKEKCQRLLYDAVDTDKEEAGAHSGDQKHDLSPFNTRGTKSAASPHPTQSGHAAAHFPDGPATSNRKTGETTLGHPVGFLRQTLSVNQHHHKATSKVQPVRLCSLQTT